MSEEKKITDRSRSKKLRKKEEERKIESGVSSALAVRVRPEIAKMTVEEAVTKEGILPMNPIDIADDEIIDKLGQHAGAIYGASVFSLVKAFTREDLPIDKRVRRAMRGIRGILNIMMEGASTYSRLNTLEDAFLYGEEERRERATVSTEDVLNEIMRRLGAIEEQIGRVKGSEGSEGGKV